MTDQRKLDARWDLHTDRQLASAKGAATAITLLNSGSWLALLTQAGSLQAEDIGSAIAFWGIGALGGTALWMFIYLSTVLQGVHDFDRKSSWKKLALTLNNGLGIACAIASLWCFGAGVLRLAAVL